MASCGYEWRVGMLLHVVHACACLLHLFRLTDDRLGPVEVGDFGFDSMRQATTVRELGHELIPKRVYDVRCTVYNVRWWRGAGDARVWAAPELQLGHELKLETAPEPQLGQEFEQHQSCRLETS